MDYPKFIVLNQKEESISIQMVKLEDLTVLKRSPDLLNNVKLGQDQLRLIMKHILFYGGYGHWQSKWVALDKRSPVSLTFGTYIKLWSH